MPRTPIRIDASQMTPGAPGRFARLLGAFALFLAIALLSLLYTKLQGRVAAVWPANALLLAVLMRAAPTRRPALAAAAWTAYVLANLITGDSLAPALLLSSLNLLEVGLAAVILAKVLRRQLDLAHARHLAVFIAVAVVAPLPGAIIASVSLPGAAWSAALATFVAWWSADVLGLLIFAPAALILASGAGFELLAPQRRRRTAANAAILLMALAVTFLQNSQPFLFIVPASLVLITFQLGLAGAAWAMIVTAVFSIAAFLNGLGPTTLAAGDAASQLRTLQFFLAFLVVTTLPLAAVLNTRRVLEQRVAKEHEATRRLADRLAAGRTINLMVQRAAGVGYWIYRPDRRETTWSDHMYELYGLENDGKVPDFDKVQQCLHPDDRELAREYVLKSLQTRLEHSQELRILTAEGSRTVLASTRVANMPDGVQAVLGVMVDVSEVRRAEAALVESESRYRQLAETVPDLILRIVDGKITYASTASRRYGYEPEMLVGLEITDLVHPDDLADARARAKANRGDGPLDPSIRREQRVRTASGDWVWLEGSPQQVRDAEGRVVEIVNAFRDVTARRALEDDLRAARAAAERANMAKTEFMSNMSHELRTPLTAIIGFAGLLRGTAKLEARDAMFVDRIDKAGKALLGLVNQVLDFSKIEAGEIVVEAVPVGLQAVLDESVGLVTPQAAAKGLTLTAENDLGDLQFVGDAGRVRQVLVNLMGNAVKFTESGGVTLRVVREGVDGAKFLVSDTGPGIPADRLGLIWDRYTQLDSSTTRTHGGTGLGLAISSGLVQAMGGQIGVESTPGEGSTFWFSLPTPPVRRSAAAH